MKSLPILYADEEITVRRHSSIDQYKTFLSVYKKGGYTPIRFDSLDGITCEKVHSHPIIISYGGLGYHYKDAQCKYASDLYMLFDRETTELKPLECWHGGKGEFYESYSKSRSFINLDNASLGLHNTKELRVGTSYVKADNSLPPVD